MTDVNSEVYLLKQKIKELELKVSEKETPFAGNGYNVLKYNSDKQPIHIVEKKMEFLIEGVYLKDKKFY